MKKLAALCLLATLLLAGCKPPSKQETEQAVYNNAGTQAVGKASSSTPVPVTGDETPGHTVLNELQSGETIYIKDNLFVAQTNDIYLNYPTYLGRTIEYEGFFDSVYWEGSDITYCYVVRYGPGCCGFDDLAGFEVYYDDDTEYPEQNAWVKVTGVLELYDEEGAAFITLRIVEMEELEERGQEYVNN